MEEVLLIAAMVVETLSLQILKCYHPIGIVCSSYFMCKKINGGLQGM